MYYALFDGRYITRPNRALVNEACDTIEDAVRSINDYGADTCIVRIDDDGKETLLFSLPNHYADDLDAVLATCRELDK